ncbi:uncharacterized protein LOC121596333 [Anopheles merus]|uniref:uncharacterized protein LOC121596333 n=1 Tax=Anopheles merus TaxID=30066 RepID=UPI001BE4A011|nr:uncharacterized protein LOC121596333 [Anopheles merus]
MSLGPVMGRTTTIQTLAMSFGPLNWTIIGPLVMDGFNETPGIQTHRQQEFHQGEKDESKTGEKGSNSASNKSKCCTECSKYFILMIPAKSLRNSMEHIRLVNFMQDLEDPQDAVEWLLRWKLLKPSQECRRCGDPMNLRTNLRVGYFTILPAKQMSHVNRPQGGCRANKTMVHQHLLYISQMRRLRHTYGKVGELTTHSNLSPIASVSKDSHTESQRQEHHMR